MSNPRITWGAALEGARVPSPEEQLRNVLPFPVLEFDERGGLVVPPREYSTIRRPETLAA